MPRLGTRPWHHALGILYCREPHFAFSNYAFSNHVSGPMQEYYLHRMDDLSAWRTRCGGATIAARSRWLKRQVMYRRTHIDDLGSAAAASVYEYLWRKNYEEGREDRA